MSNQPNPNVFFRGEDMGIGNFPIKGGTMNQPINDGEPAFPTPVGVQNDGMTLRDYFAANAMSAVLKELWQQGEHSSPIPPLAAKFAYEMADTMIKAREMK
jgi:hypothetical protein